MYREDENKFMKKENLIFTFVSMILVLMLGFSVMFSSFGIASFRNFQVKQKIPSLAPMLEKVIPSVVSICIEGSTVSNIPKSSKNYNFLSGNTFLLSQKYFSLNNLNNYKLVLRQNNLKSNKFTALGSGVIIDSNKGYVVTNNHVIDNADKIEVLLNDGRQYSAKVVGSDPNLDIALIQLNNATNLTSIDIANSDTLKVGDYTIAIGNPYGLGETVTSGIISALGRSGLNIEHYESFIQTDAAINKGNSGGALVNFRGELIGINTAILAPDGGNIGIGFAIPSNIVKNLINQMVTYGQFKRGELGIVGTELNFKLANIMNVYAQKGTFISQVLPKSAADRSGMMSGDVIVALNGKLVYSFSALRAEVSSMPIETEIVLGILRNGNMKQFIIKLQKSVRDKIHSSNIYVGIEGAELNDYDYLNQKGVKINNVKLNTAAFKIGFKKGDVIFEVNKQPIYNTKDLSSFLKNEHSLIVFSVKRDSNVVYLIIQ